MSDSFFYTSVKDPLATPLLEELLFEYDSRYGTFFNAEGAKAELNKYPPEAFSPPSGNFLLLLRIQAGLDPFRPSPARACENRAPGTGAAGDPAGLCPRLSDHRLPSAGSGRSLSHQWLSRFVRYRGRSRDDPVVALRKISFRHGHLHPGWCADTGRLAATFTGSSLKGFLR
jgi:hypothetical protein